MSYMGKLAKAFVGKTLSWKQIFSFILHLYTDDTNSFGLFSCA